MNQYFISHVNKQINILKNKFIIPILGINLFVLKIMINKDLINIILYPKENSIIDNNLYNILDMYKNEYFTMFIIDEKCKCIDILNNAYGGYIILNNDYSSISYKNLNINMESHYNPVEYFSNIIYNENNDYYNLKKLSDKNKEILDNIKFIGDNKDLIDSNVNKINKIKDVDNLIENNKLFDNNKFEIMNNIPSAPYYHDIKEDNFNENDIGNNVDIENYNNPGITDNHDYDNIIKDLCTGKYYKSEINPKAITYINRLIDYVNECLNSGKCKDKDKCKIIKNLKQFMIKYKKTFQNYSVSILREDNKKSIYYKNKLNKYTDIIKKSKDLGYFITQYAY